MTNHEVRRKRANMPLRAALAILALAALCAGIIYTAGLSAGGQSRSEYPSPGTVYTVAFSQDGTKTFYSMTENKVLAVDAQQNVLFTCELPKAGLALSVVEDKLYVACEDRHAYVYDMDGKLLLDIKDPYRLAALSGNADATRVLVGAYNTATKNRVRLYDETGKALWDATVRSPTQEIYLYPEGDRLLVISRSAEIKIARAEEALTELKLQKIEYAPYCWAVRPGAGMVLVGDEGDTVHAFDMELNPLFAPVKMEAKVNSVDVDSANESILVVLDNAKMVMLDYAGQRTGVVDVPNETRKVYVNQAGGQAIVLNKLNDKLLVLDTGSQRRAATNQIIAKVMLYVNIALALALIVCAINLAPAFAARFWAGLWAGCKNVLSHKVSYLLLLPTFALLFTFNYYPAVRGLFLAFFDYVPNIHMRFVGLANFKSMVSNSYFWVGVGNLVIFLVTDMMKALIPPILFAEIILAMRSKQGQYWTRVALYLPGILPGIAGMLVWGSGILSYNGVLNALLKGLHLIGDNVSWLGDEKTAIWALVLIGFPWIGSYIIFYGALISVPDALFDAAKVDGCRWFRRVLRIDIPLIGPQIKFVFVTAFIGSVQEFGRAYILTSGGPGTSTYTPMLELFYNMSKFQNFGIASAMGLSMFVVLFTATLFNLRMNIGSDAGQL